MKKLAYSTLLLLTLTAAGCEDSVIAPVGPAPQPQPPVAAKPTPSPTPGNPAPNTVAGTPSVTPEGVPANAEVARPGEGALDPGYGGDIFTEPIRSLFTIEQWKVLDIQIPQALQFYKAEHDGKVPQTHDDFMKVIVKENFIQLPMLPDHLRWIWSPKNEKLMTIPFDKDPK